MLQRPKVNHVSAVHPEQPDIACVAIDAGRHKRLSIPHGAVFHNLAGMKKTNRLYRENMRSAHVSGNQRWQNLR